MVYFKFREDREAGLNSLRAGNAARSFVGYWDDGLTDTSSLRLF